MKLCAVKVGLVIVRVDKAVVLISRDLGPEQYENAILPFYKALKVYPAPMELVMIYQKTVPEPVFTTIVNILAIEV